MVMRAVFLRMALGIVVGVVLGAGGCATVESSDTSELVQSAAAITDSNDPTVKRRSGIFKELRTMSPEEFPKTNVFGSLLRGDEYGGALDAGRAVEAFAAGEGLKALLFAQASVGADPGNSARRTLLHLISTKSGIAPETDGELPRPALVSHELALANAAFFEERFGEALQRSRRALLLDEASVAGWKARASAELALGDEDRAKVSYARAVQLAPNDKRLVLFLKNRGWK